VILDVVFLRINEHSRGITKSCEIIVSFASRSSLWYPHSFELRFPSSRSRNIARDPHLRKNTRKRILEFRFDSLPRLPLLHISLFHALLNYYSLVELVSSAPAQLICKLDHKTPQLETTSPIDSSMSSNAPTEVFTTSNVFLDVLVKTGITHAFVKYVYLIAISPCKVAKLPSFDSLGSDHPALLEASISRQKYKLPTLKIITCPNEVRELISKVSLLSSADCFFDVLRHRWSHCLFPLSISTTTRSTMCANSTSSSDNQSALLQAILSELQQVKLNQTLFEQKVSCHYLS